MLAELSARIRRLVASHETNPLSSDELGSAPPTRRLNRIEICDYPQDLQMRWGQLTPPHDRIAAILDESKERFISNLKAFAEFDALLADIPMNASDSQADGLHWDNGFFAPLDVVSLYGIVAHRKPSTYLEIGSGNSTKVVARAKREHRLRTRIVSIDPEPRAECDRLCDQIYRQPLERMDLSIFDALKAGDVIFFDGSHRLLQNSDTTVLYLDVLPRLPPGVLVHQHDVFWPDDYPDPWADRLYSEQYALAILLLFRNPPLSILMANAHVTRTLSPGKYFPRISKRLTQSGKVLQMEGCSFWFEW